MAKKKSGRGEKLSKQCWKKRGNSKGHGMSKDQRNQKPLGEDPMQAAARGRGDCRQKSRRSPKRRKPIPIVERPGDPKEAWTGAGGEAKKRGLAVGNKRNPEGLRAAKKR